MRLYVFEFSIRSDGVYGRRVTHCDGRVYVTPDMQTNRPFRVNILLPRLILHFTTVARHLPHMLNSIRHYVLQTNIGLTLKGHCSSLGAKALKCRCL